MIYGAEQIQIVQERSNCANPKRAKSPASASEIVWQLRRSQSGLRALHGPCTALHGGEFSFRSPFDISKTGSGNKKERSGR